MKKTISTILKGLVFAMAISLTATGAAAAEKEPVYSPFTSTEPDWAMEFPAPTTLKLPSFFQNKMLFQQQQPIGVWGVDVPGTEVTVTLASDKLTRTGKAVAGKTVIGVWSWTPLRPPSLPTLLPSAVRRKKR